jgi:hypothetical protein
MNVIELQHYVKLEDMVYTGNEGGEANKEKAQHMFSNQIDFIFISM